MSGEDRDGGGREKVEGIPLDGFIFLYEKEESEYGMGKRQRFGKATVGKGEGLGTNRTIAGQWFVGLVLAEPQMVGLQGLGTHHLFTREKMNRPKGLECSLTLKNDCESKAEKQDGVGI